MSLKRRTRWLAIGACLVWTPIWAAQVEASAAVVAPQAISGPMAVLVSALSEQLFSLQVEAPAGVLTNMALSSQGNALRIDFRGATRQNVMSVVQSIQQQTKIQPDVRHARAVFINEQDAYVWVELAQPYELTDQAVMAVPGDRSRWEVVLNKVDLNKSALELRDIQMLGRDDVLDVRLQGSPDLTAAVSILDKPTRVVIELPGTRPEAIEKLANAFRPGPAPFIKRLSANTESKVPQLVLEMYQDIDLVDSEGFIQDGQGRIRLSLSSDRVPQSGASGLRSIDGQLTPGKQVQIKLQGVDPGSVRAYTVDEPPRLVMDVLGLTPQQAQAAVNDFKSPHPGVLGARLESTRLGSARLVFDLSSKVPVVARGSASAALAGSGYTVVLRTPADPQEPGYVALPNVATVPVSLSQRGAKVDEQTPLIIIRPVYLQPPAPLPQDPSKTSGPGATNGLMRLFETALKQDPKYQAALKDFDISSEAIPQARAGYLPTAMLDAQRTRVRQEIEQNTNNVFTSGSSSYTNTNRTLTITQPILKWPALVKMTQAKRSVEQARFNLVAAEQDLMLRLASAYLNVSAASDGVELADAERLSTQKQLELAKVRLSNGLGNVTQVFDAESRFGLARARVVEARNRLDDARQGLKEILGAEVPQNVNGFKADFAASGPIPAEIDPWVTAAADQNLNVLSRKLAVEIAELEIKRQQAGYAPTLNLVATSLYQDSGGTLYGGPQRYTNNEVGVRLNVPLFEGGMTTSLVREAKSRQEKTENEYEQELRRSQRQARAAFNAVLASLELQEALRKSVVAQQSALESREEGVKSGLSTPVAVIDAYRLFYTAKRDYLQARYDYLVNRLKLKQSVGTLERGDLEDLGVMLEQ